eukprot:42392_1
MSFTVLYYFDVNDTVILKDYFGQTIAVSSRNDQLLDFKGNGGESSLWSVEIDCELNGTRVIKFKSTKTGKYLSLCNEGNDITVSNDGDAFSRFKVHKTESNDTNSFKFESVEFAQKYLSAQSNADDQIVSSGECDDKYTDFTVWSNVSQNTENKQQTEVTVVTEDTAVTEVTEIESLKAKAETAVVEFDLASIKVEEVPMDFKETETAEDEETIYPAHLYWTRVICLCCCCGPIIMLIIAAASSYDERHDPHHESYIYAFVIMFVLWLFAFAVACTAHNVYKCNSNYFEYRIRSISLLVASCGCFVCLFVMIMSATTGYFGDDYQYKGLFQDVAWFGFIATWIFLPLICCSAVIYAKKKKDEEDEKDEESFDLFKRGVSLWGCAAIILLIFFASVDPFPELWGEEKWQW